jgi:N utilization substance protein A
MRLFQAEVPEIAERVVEIKAVAREAGHRSKIAVVSHDSRIDAVGACVGIKGSRVQAIVKELGGERIDIVPWATDPVVFVSRALSPARVLSAKVDEANHQVTVMVPDDQLSLAIGKQGQNVRLAAKLTGWKIELHSQSEFDARSAAAAADAPLRNLDPTSEQAITALATAGVTTASQVERLGLEELAKVNGVTEAMAERIYGLALAALATARSAAAQAATQQKQVTPAVDETEEVDESTDEELEGAADEELEAAADEELEATTDEESEASADDTTDEPDFESPSPDMSGAGATGDEPHASGGMS